jgi:NADP-dependent 3-hydroxy acid dehydrogenase YdfG
MTQPSAYQDKIAIVTGGASGIGAALAKEIAGSGAQVVLADRQSELAESVAASIRERGGSAVAMELDVREFGAVQQVVNQTLARFGRVDYFFNNAGIIGSGEAAAYEVDDWSDVFDVNIRGVAFGIQAVYPVMIRQRSGHIINTASVAGLLTTPGLVSYSTSKHAVIGLSKAFAGRRQALRSARERAVSGRDQHAAPHRRQIRPHEQRAADRRRATEGLGTVSSAGRRCLREARRSCDRPQRSDHHRAELVEVVVGDRPHLARDRRSERDGDVRACSTGAAAVRTA